MEAHSVRRIFSTTRFNRILTATLLVLVFGITFFGTPSSTLAVGETKYKDLFGVYNAADPVDTGTAGAVARTESGVYYIGSTAFYNGVKEFYLGLNLMFPGVNNTTSNDDIDKLFWDYVGNNNGNASSNGQTNDSFVLRTYRIVNGQPDTSTIQYNSNIYTKLYRATGSTVNNSTGGIGAPGTTTTIGNNATTYGNTLYKKEDYTDASGTLHDKDLINQLVNVPIKVSTAIPYGSQMGADFWYCGGEPDSTNPNISPGDFGPNAIPSGFNNSVAFFPGLCGGTAYWKIGPSIRFTMPASQADRAGGAIDTTQAQSGSGYTQSAGVISDGLPECGLGVVSGTLMGCVARVVYWLIYWPIAWFAGLMGSLFDFFMGYSLSDASYRAEFAVRGWQIVRDISNIFFIIILVWTGLSAVFNTSGNSMKKVVPQLILNALLINFSLFGTRVVIDVSNVVARVFYKSVEVCDGKCNKDPSTGVITNIKKGVGGFTPLSEKIVSAFNPQRIFSTGIIDQSKAVTSVDTSKTASSEAQTAGYFIIVSLIAAFILFAIAMMFWKTAFFFVGRVIGLYMAMIFAPFAVLTKGGMPLVGNIKELSWSEWASDLTKYALLAPIFVFFLYVIYSFLETDFIKVYADKVGTTFFETVVYISIPMIIVYFMIKAGVGIAESYAGKIGKAVQGFVQSATGLVGGAALGIATGGAALAGRNVLGRLGARVAESGTLQNASAQGGIRGWLADRTIQAGSGMSRATYDARNTSLSRNLQSATGVGITNSGVGRLLGTNTDRTAGGFTGAIGREVATETARAQRFQLTGQQAATQDNLNRAWETAYQAARNTAQQTANAQGVVFDENAFRGTYETQQAAAANARPETTAQINRRREQQNNARLTRGTILARVSRVVTNRATAPTGAAGVAANALGAAIVGNAAIAAATVVGQGAIENAAQQQVAQARAGAARAPLNPAQVTNLQNRVTQLQNELTRRITVMNTIGAALTPPVNYTNLTAAGVIDYQTDRQRDINNLQTAIDVDQDIVDRTPANPTYAQIAAVNAAKSRIRTRVNDQNTHKNNIRQAGTILSEYTRIQSDIDGIRTQLANN